MAPSITAGPRVPRDRLVYGGLALAVLLSRLPFLPGAGLGRDPDAWRLYLAGQIAAGTGTYAPSRPPGYPALELLSTVLHAAPWWVFAASTTAVTIGAVLALAALARDLGARAWPLVGVGVAFTSVVFTNSTAFMDYNWALAALAGALWAARRCRPLRAGALVGLAVACRPSSVLAATAFLVVFALVPWWNVRRVLSFAAAGASVTLAFFAVPLATYGLRLVSAAPEPFRLGRTLQLLVVGGWGVYGAVGLGLVAAVAGRRWIRERGTRSASRERVWLLALGISIAVQVAGFFVLPIDAGYLTPAIAMGWVAAGLLLERVELAGLTVAAVAGCVLPGVLVPSAVEIGTDRRATMVETAGMLAAVRELPPGTVVVSRGRLPQLLAMAGASLPAELDPVGTDARVTLRGGQVLVYSFSEADRGNPRVYRLADVGGAPRHLPVLKP